MKAILVSPEAEASYSAFLSTHPARMLYYSLAYRDLLASHLDCEARYFAAVDGDGAVHGILPTMIRNGPYGPVVNSLPFFGSHGGVLADGEDAERTLWEAW